MTGASHDLVDRAPDIAADPTLARTGLAGPARVAGIVAKPGARHRTTSHQLAIAALVSLASPAIADPERPTDAWTAQRGEVEPGLAPGSYLISSDAAPGRYSEAAMMASSEIELPYQLDLHVRRLGPEAGRSVHVIVGGGIVLIKQNAILFYAYDDAAFAQQGWKPVTDYKANDDHAIRVRQDHRQVTVTLDGRPPVTFALPVSRTRARVGVGMKSAPGYRSQLLVHDLVVTHLGR